jgi:hypothetical protein
MVSATIIKDPRDDAQIEDVNAAELHAVVCVGVVCMLNRPPRCCSPMVRKRMMGVLFSSNRILFSEVNAKEA